ncbi:hypothetical protein BDV19DRAFT_360158 [Aspergillus venezuelensis]
MSAPHDAYWQAQRRKVRKGTHSCWECKRRKMKCRIDARIDSNSCIGCRRRGSPCISQEFPEDLSGVRTPSATPNDTANILTPLSTTTRADPSQRKYERLSRLLHGLLPPQNDIQSICKASRDSSILSHELLTTPYITLYQNGLQTPETLLTTPDSSMHPVLIARYMLQLALFLQHLPPYFHKDIIGLSEPPRAIMERLADVAIYHVTTNEDLIGSIESLECIMLESSYQVNIGNLRRSWVAGRRAIGVAQLIGIHRPDNQTRHKTLDPRTQHNPQIMWLRIMNLDRHLCLLLGLPEGSADQSMASEIRLANDCPMGRLEHLHCVIMSRVLKRNAAKPSDRDLADTRAIDLELQKAAGSLPSKWWLAPKFDNATTDLQAVFWDTRRLVLQICHYNLLNQIHLPYMLRPSSEDRPYEYSRITCVNASREVLSRYNSLRSFNHIAYSCRTVDFIAVMAAMTLLLAHMDGYQDGADNLLANQYLSDRGIIEQVQEHMNEMNRLNSDELSAQSADLLKALLAIDMEKGPRRVSVRDAGVGRTSWQGGLIQEEPEGEEEKEEGVVRVHVPYFGIIRIVRDAPTKRQPATTTTNDSDSQLRLSSLTHASTLTPPANNTPNPLSFTVGDIAASHEFTAPFAYQHPHHQQQQQYQTNLPDPGLALTSSPLMQGGFPELAADGEDWAFQGVDMAFFESIMRNIGGDI